MNKEFKWDDSLIKEFLSENFFSYALNQTLEERLNKFKESKQPKPEWEIIQVSSPECGLYYLDGYKMRPDDKIYSVKRLSDNSVWVLDDKFIANAGCVLTIKRFDVTETGMQVWSKEFGFWFLEEIKKPALFTTEDGVDVYTGDDYYFINTEWEIMYTGDNYAWIGDNLKAFSSEKSAQEYILMNKPLLSVNNVIDILQGTYYLPELIEKARNNKP